MTKIAILYICIGKYDTFWKDFYISFEERFTTECEKEYFVFTDSKFIYGENVTERIHRIHQENLGWPGNTLFRFKMFLQIIPELKKFDYTFFMNANVICKERVTEEMMLPKDEKLVVVQHPGYYKQKPYEFEYDRNRKSKAYIPYYKGEVYICGGINGGRTEAYIELIKTLNKNINSDIENGIIARWHDESHINRYILDNTCYKLLSPAYCYPENWDIPFTPILVVLDKKDRICLDSAKTAEQCADIFFLEKIKKQFIQFFWKLIYILK